MNDNAPRGVAWQRLVGQYLASKLGGGQESWGKANKLVAEREFAKYNERFSRQPSADYLGHLEQRDEDWLRDMCGLVGVASPTGRQECVSLARETSAFVTRRVGSSFPGAVEAIRELNAAGYSLFTASGEESWHLDGYLDGMGVRDLFHQLYGPDLVNKAKYSADYYQRAFAHASVAPSDAIVVDDSPLALGWAREVGAITILVSPKPPDFLAVDGVVPRLAQLPAILRTAHC